MDHGKLAIIKMHLIKINFDRATRQPGNRATRQPGDTATGTRDISNIYPYVPRGRGGWGPFKPDPTPTRPRPTRSPAAKRKGDPKAARNLKEDCPTSRL